MDRPRRSTRVPARIRNEPSSPSSPPPEASSTTTKATKRKPKESQPDEQESFYHSLVSNPKSPLTRMDISEIINATTWNMLSEKDRAELALLLPPTAFDNFRPFLDDYHPSVDRSKLEELKQEAKDPQPAPPAAEAASAQNAPEAQPMEVDAQPSAPEPSTSTEASTQPSQFGAPESSTEAPAEATPPLQHHEPNTSFFTDSHFLAAAHTWQDHIYSKWTSEAHGEKVKRYLEGVHNGTLAAPWKDEVWERENKPPESAEVTKGSGSATGRGRGKAKLAADSSGNALAGEAAEIRLPTLTRAGVFRVGDIIAYKRHFIQANITVEKDVIVDSIGKSHALNVRFASGTTQHLPLPLVLPDSDGTDAPSDIQSALITTPSMLETALLDTDGRVDKTKRANSNAWKHFTIYRWRGETVGDLEDGRGGRESHGTMFYLRGTYWHER